jgi:hypothetical protein
MLPMFAAIVLPSFAKAHKFGTTNTCIENLRQIDIAKQTWALENKKDDSQVPTSHDLDIYLKNGFSALVCPAGGTYSINSVGQKPTCSIPSHKLPDN